MAALNLATAGITTIDLGGAGVIANASFGYGVRGMFLALDDNLLTGSWTSALGGNTVNGSSLARGNAVVYSSPTLGGFNVQAAIGEDDVWDAAVRYAGEFSGFRVAAGVGFAHNVSGTNEVVRDVVGATDVGKIEQWKGSASIMHVASGLYLTGAYVSQDNHVVDRPDTTMWYVNGGITKNWFGPGATTLYGEYARVNDGINCVAGGCTSFGGNANDIITDSQADDVGPGHRPDVDAAAMEVSWPIAITDAWVVSAPGNLLSGKVNYNDIDVVYAGARVKF